MEKRIEKWESLRLEAQQFVPQEYCEICEDEVTYRMKIYQHADAWEDNGNIVGQYDNADQSVANVNIPGHIHQYADPTGATDWYILPEEIVIDLELHDGWIKFGKNPAPGYDSKIIYPAKVSRTYQIACGLEEYNRKEKNHS